ncbi:hypothetical protein [Metabacillus halosaccharovorans]|uniref:hypothetical protein n=1 Tax=Metabacillus halosaccharovorans TaxID=930124 RepID=UPI0009951345|nr:hypothetical protein [Metabacillus halosaccharovorans]
MNKDKIKMYIFLILGGIGLALVGLGGVMFIEIDNMKGYLTVICGFLITISYIEFLERRAGISKKIIWVRAIVG